VSKAWFMKGINIKFIVKLEKTAIDICRMFQQVYGRGTMSADVFWWGV
jgi:hypothetical protein